LSKHFFIRHKTPGTHERWPKILQALSAQEKQHYPGGLQHWILKFWLTELIPEIKYTCKGHLQSNNLINCDFN